MRLQIFRADAGPATRVERLPAWLVASLAELGDTAWGVDLGLDGYAGRI